MGKLSLSGYTIYLRLLAMKRLNAIRPGLNCFISMIISVASSCGFQPSSCAIFAAIFYVKKRLKLLAMASRIAQWVHLFSMNYDDFSTILGYFNGKTISLWVHHIDVINIDWAFQCHSTNH